MNATSAAAAGRARRTGATSNALAFRSRSMCSMSSTALIDTCPWNSSIAGRILPVISSTASLASRTEGKRPDPSRPPPAPG